MRLVVFFSRGMSLEGWERAGILDRELALYRAMRPHLESLAFVTYGGTRDLDLGRQIPGLEILANRGGLSPNLYSLAALWLHRRALGGATVFKTNQINGGWSAALARWLFGKKLVVRCGYLWSDSALQPDYGWIRRTAVTRLERWIFRAADRVIVAAAIHREAIVGRYGVDRARVEVIPNYVDTAQFRPLPGIAAEPGRVTFVGRLSAEKNPMALLDAVDGVPGLRLVMIGDGALRSELQASAERRGLNVEFLGTRCHHELPALLARSTAFALVSQYEGNPKALLEAMACGVPVIGTRVRGIQDVVEHRRTGLLCGSSPLEIRAAIQETLSDPELRRQMIANALAYVRTTCSLDGAVAGELAVLTSLTGGPAHA